MAATPVWSRPYPFHCPNSAFPIAFYEVLRDLTAYLAAFDTGVSFAELTAAAASPDVKGVLGLVSGEGKTSEEVYAAAMSARQQLRQNFQEYFTSQQLDAIIFPTTVLPAARSKVVCKQSNSMVNRCLHYPLTFTTPIPRRSRPCQVSVCRWV